MHSTRPELPEPQQKEPYAVHTKVLQFPASDVATMVVHASELPRRGVYLAPYRIDGAPALVAVNSAGDRVGLPVCLSADLPLEQAVAVLWRRLNDRDAVDERRTG